MDELALDYGHQLDIVFGMFACVPKVIIFMPKKKDPVPVLPHFNEW